MHRLEQALTEADWVMGFAEIARELLCGDKERENEAAKKFTRLTDYVTDQILDRADLNRAKSDYRLEKVYIFNKCNVLAITMRLNLDPVSGAFIEYSEKRADEAHWNSSNG